MWKRQNLRKIWRKWNIWCTVALLGILIVIATSVIIVRMTSDLSLSRNIYKEAEKACIQQKEHYNFILLNRDNMYISDSDIWWNDIDVDISALSKEYPDVIGWIYFENEDISYPIAYSEKNNAKYLRNAYTGEHSTAGTIFLDGGNSPLMTDINTIIYGHNMKNGTMFGKLKNYRRDPEYYAGHQYFRIYTPDAIFRYQIFAYEDIPDNHLVYSATGPRQENYESIIRDLCANSLRKTDIYVGPSDRLVTLSTCTDDENKRFVVCGVQVAEHIY